MCLCFVVRFYSKDFYPMDRGHANDGFKAEDEETGLVIVDPFVMVARDWFSSSGRRGQVPNGACVNQISTAINLCTIRSLSLPKTHPESVIIS